MLSNVPLRTACLTVVVGWPARLSLTSATAAVRPSETSSCNCAAKRPASDPPFPVALSLSRDFYSFRSNVVSRYKLYSSSCERERRTNKPAWGLLQGRRVTVCAGRTEWGARGKSAKKFSKQRFAPEGAADGWRKLLLMTNVNFVFEDDDAVLLLNDSRGLDWRQCNLSRSNSEYVDCLFQMQSNY